MASETEKSKIQQQIDEAKEKHRQGLYQKRLEISRDAFQKLKAGSYPEATEGFKTYIRILEDYFKVEEGGLDPSLFDIKKDSSELLLISGTYWDLVKLLDRTRSPAKLKELELYLRKFLLFSKKMPHQKISVDTLEKYLSTNQPFHRKQFEEVQKALGGSSKCYVITAHLPQVGSKGLDRYREFRDGVLRKSRMGRRLVGFYYLYGPGAARWFEKRPRALRSATGYLFWLGSFAAAWITRRLAK